MLHIRSNLGIDFDWNKITVEGLDGWTALHKTRETDHLAVTLFQGRANLNNYRPRFVGNADDYEFGRTGDTDAVDTVTVEKFMLDGDRFQNAGKERTVTAPGTTARGTYAGLSIYGNTTNHNELNLTGGSHADARAGYTDAKNGGADANTLNL